MCICRIYTPAIPTLVNRRGESDLREENHCTRTLCQDLNTRMFYVGVISASLSDAVYEEKCAMVLLKAVLVITKNIGDDANIDV